jgi:hypothetical protein
MGSRTRSPAFPFGEGHPKSSTHEQVLLSKVHVPQIVGSIPTCPAVYDESSEAQGECFARFILTLFKPWSIPLGTPTDSIEDFSWKGMCDFLKELKNKNGWYERAILKRIENLKIGLRTTNARKVMATDFRHRGAKVWANAATADGKGVDSDRNDSDTDTDDGNDADHKQMIFGDDSYGEFDDELNEDQKRVLDVLKAYMAGCTEAKAAQGSTADMYLEKQINMIDDLTKARF